MPKYYWPVKPTEVTYRGHTLKVRKYSGYLLLVGPSHPPFRCHGKNKDGSRCQKMGSYLKVHRWDGKIVPAYCGSHVTHQCQAMDASGQKRCQNWVWQMERFCSRHKRARCHTFCQVRAR